MHNWRFEDVKAGARFETGGKTLSEAEILEFALLYDPQPFHMDVHGAESGPFGGLIASGVQTFAIGLRLLFQARIFDPDLGMGSPGVDELRWVRPVRPGDTLRARGEVLDARPSRSKPDRGIVRHRMEVLNQRGEVVLQMTCAQFMRRSPPAPSG